MTEEIKKELDELVENLKKTFEDVDSFEPEEGVPWSLWRYSSDLEYPIEKYLISEGGGCNWENIDYVEHAARVDIHAGEKDSFGWLTGVIELLEEKDGKVLQICYG